MNPDECRKELKPCPFCGASISKRDRFNIKCDGCGVEMNALPHLLESSWNSRTESKPVTREEMTRETFDTFCNSIAGSAIAGQKWFDEAKDQFWAATQLSAPQSPVVPGVSELDDVVDQAEKTWTLSGASKLGPKSTFIASIVAAYLLATGGRESRGDRYREALERIEMTETIDHAQDIASEAIATTNAKEPKE